MDKLQSHYGQNTDALWKNYSRIMDKIQSHYGQNKVALWTKYSRIMDKLQSHYGQTTDELWTLACSWLSITRPCILTGCIHIEYHRKATTNKSHCNIGTIVFHISEQFKVKL